MGFSYSKVECHNQCPYKYYLRYVKKVESEPDLSPNNPLFLGLALHEGIEKRSIDAALENYKKHYPEITAEHEAEMSKLSAILPIAIKDIPEGDYEKRISNEDGFVGFIDMLVPVEDGVYDLYDFKYSNSVDRYSRSAQIHVYKYYYEKATGNKIRDMYYVMIPKCEDVSNAKISFVKIDYDTKKVSDFFGHKILMEKDTAFIKRKSRLCDWCEYKAACNEVKNESERCD